MNKIKNQWYRILILMTIFSFWGSLIYLFWKEIISRIIENPSIGVICVVLFATICMFLIVYGVFIYKEADDESKFRFGYEYRIRKYYNKELEAFAFFHLITILFLIILFVILPNLLENVNSFRMIWKAILYSISTILCGGLFLTFFALLKSSWKRFYEENPKILGFWN